MTHNVNCKELRNKHRCQYCTKGYMMEWAKINHEKHCRERNNAIEKNPKRYGQ